MFCLCGLLCVVVCNVFLAVLLFGCMFVVFWLSCFAVGNLVGLGCDWFGFCGWVGVWCCWECCLGCVFFLWFGCFVLSVRCVGINGFVVNVFCLLSGTIVRFLLTDDLCW